MAVEDHNIWVYVKQFGASHHKRKEFWDQGYESFLWRKGKSVESLRNRERFYVCHLNAKDIKIIKDHIRKNPKTPSYTNFASIGQDIRKLVSISNDRPEETIAQVASNVPKSNSLFYSPQDRL